MLSRLSVRNFALIDAVDLQLESGLTVLTGETGAGKSILFNAVELLMGERASADLIRRDSDEAMVQGVIVPSESLRQYVADKLEEAGVPFEGELIVRRQVSRSGRNRAWLNDHMVTSSLIAELVPRCIDILGQHQHLSLVDPTRQERLIDQAGTHEELLEQMGAAYAAWREASKRLKSLQDAADERLERIEFLRFQLRELAGLELKRGEFDELERKVNMLRYSEKLRRAGEAASSWLVESERAAIVALGEAQASLKDVSSYDERVFEWNERLEEAKAIVDDVSRDVAMLLEDAPEVDEIDEIMARHEALRKAMRRFGADEDGLISRFDELRLELSTLESYEESLATSLALVQKCLSRAEECANLLASARTGSAKALFDEVEVRLGMLGMEHATLSWTRDEGEQKLRRTGWSGWSLFFSANPGEAPRPIGKVASGGELSRLLLALKSVLLERDPIDSYLFDEIDTGIGGQAAVVVGSMLRDIGEARQVLCITHLPQIAGKAHHQLLVEKRIEGNRTSTHIRALHSEEREVEITRMLGGNTAGDATRAHARELLGMLH